VIKLLEQKIVKKATKAQIVRLKVRWTIPRGGGGRRLKNLRLRLLGNYLHEFG